MPENPFLSNFYDEYLNQNPEAAMYAAFNPFMASVSPFGQFIRGSQNRYMGKYTTALGQNPGLRLMDFLRTLNPQDEFQALAPSLRGENASRFAPPVRWLPSRY